MASIYNTWADGDAFTAADLNTLLMRQVNISCDNQTDRDAILTPQAGMSIYRVDLKGFEIYDGTDWNIVPRILKKVTLTSASDTITANNIPLRDFLKVRAIFKASGAISPRMYFNNDTANNYSYQYSHNGAAYGASASQPGIIVRAVSAGAGEAYANKAIIDIVNLSTEFKAVEVEANDAFGTNATTYTNFATYKGKYASNTQVSRIDFTNIGAGDFAIGTTIEIIG